ncbi:UDP-N-acetylglucosamine 1-carboxyvinyltransferase [Candidatus Xenohaliotis californiensis]|uniref:UDP-N-acetylglucosamine 1-carboxyvinyltransferase n=1 Tax=Candidatus Xenohaliotis californiensis TaxID=84677 RepID=A0ABP0EYK6_9RICK|nr:UDP-N-acetylglucosamine 1-carboxyvinyltransferase [Candidatus Xenohaliotis californiensis]
MQKILVNGGKPLVGKIKISGSKNSALPIIAASLMSTGTINIKNVPNISDVQSMLSIINYTGSNAVYKNNNNVIINCNCKLNTNFSGASKIMQKLRGSSLVMGASLAVNGHVVIPATGGCNIGQRPLNMHLNGFRKLGAKIQHLDNSLLLISVPKSLQGAKINMSKISVGATENILMAATMADGFTEINNAAMEPEIVDLANFLNKMGANIQGAGTSTITIKGTTKLSNDVDHTVESDRIEAASYALAAMITKGEITLIGNKLIQKSVANKIKEAGGIINQCANAITITAPYKINPINISTMPYPDFPSDAQPQFTALLSLASGCSTIQENIFENRFAHTEELKKMGANIYTISENTIQINGVRSLQAAEVQATNLRSAMSLVIAALSAKGETLITNPFHLDRGYENPELKLSQCGAKLKRLTEKIDI